MAVTARFALMVPGSPGTRIGGNEDIAMAPLANWLGRLASLKARCSPPARSAAEFGAGHGSVSDAAVAVGEQAQARSVADPRQAVGVNLQVAVDATREFHLPDQPWLCLPIARVEPAA